MAKTPIEIDALDTYTDAQMLKLARWAIVEVKSNPEASVSVGGRSYTLVDLNTLREMESYWNAKVNTANRPRVLLGDVSGEP